MNRDGFERGGTMTNEQAVRPRRSRALRAVGWGMLTGAAICALLVALAVLL